jgi:hypothetical protein
MGSAEQIQFCGSPQITQQFVTHISRQLAQEYKIEKAFSS